MCRNITQLRPKYDADSDEIQPATADEIKAAALQYIRKVSGYRGLTPAPSGAPRVYGCTQGAPRQPGRFRTGRGPGGGCHPDPAGGTGEPGPLNTYPAYLFNAGMG